MLLPTLLKNSGCTIKNYNDFLLQILKSIYGETSAPKRWQETLRRCLEKHGFKVIEHEKIGADASILFQLANSYFYKITVLWNKYIRFLVIVFVMGPVNIMGLLARFIFPKNPDLFLDNIVLVSKSP